MDRNKSFPVVVARSVNVVACFDFLDHSLSPYFLGLVFTKNKSQLNAGKLLDVRSVR